MVDNAVLDRLVLDHVARHRVVLRVTLGAYFFPGHSAGERKTALDTLISRLVRNQCIESVPHFVDGQSGYVLTRSGAQLINAPLPKLKRDEVSGAPVVSNAERHVAILRFCTLGQRLRYLVPSTMTEALVGSIHRAMQRPHVVESVDEKRTVLRVLTPSSTASTKTLQKQIRTTCEEMDGENLRGIYRSGEYAMLLLVANEHVADGVRSWSKAKHTGVIVDALSRYPIPSATTTAGGA